MNNESPRHSVAPNRPIDPAVICVLRSLDPVARAANCPYFVAGATARDLVLVNVHGLGPGRATRDLDFGIAIENWEQFALLKNSLTASQFAAAGMAQQRLNCEGPDGNCSIPIDLIPFRGVASAGATISWPPR